MKETIYRINGKDFLEKHYPGKQFCFCRKPGEWEPVSISEIWVSGGPVNFQIHAQIVYPEPIRIDYVISKEQYENWQKTKGEKRRINLLLAISQNTLKIRKIPANKHIDIRVTAELYDTLKSAADSCKMPLSDYCREVLKGGPAPRAALSSEELTIMKNVADVKHNMVQFRDASLGVLKEVPKEDRLKFIIQGLPYSWWREAIRDCLIYLDSMINKVKQ